MREKRRILVLSPRCANPPNTGAKLREYHLLRAMARWADLTVMTLAGAGEEPRLDFAKVERFDRPRGYTAGKIVKGLLGSQALSVLNYRSEALAVELRRKLAGGGYDVVWLEALQMGAYLEELEALAPGVLRVWDWHNIESELMLRYAERAPSVLHGIYARETGRRLRKLEGKILAGRDGHLVCSEREAEKLGGWEAEARVAVAPNGVDCGSFPGWAQPRREGVVLFVGSLDYHPNIEGLEFFVRRVWPEVMRRRPEMRLKIVGSRPVEAVRQLGTAAGVELVGPVPRVEPYYEEAAVAVVPLFSGAGTRLKVLEAFAAGTPVVSTQMGVEGIDAVPGEHYLRVENEEEWAEAVLAPEERKEAIRRRGRELVEARYDWRSVGEKVEEAVEGWLGRTER